MKKCVCGFETPNNNFCPICGRQLEIDKRKRTYTMGLSAEECITADIEMTYEEAEIVRRVLKELNSQAHGYCGHCWIES